MSGRRGLGHVSPYLGGLAIALSVFATPLRAEPAAPADPVITMTESLRAYRPLLQSLLQRAGIAYPIELYPTERARQMLLHGQSVGDAFRGGEYITSLGETILVTHPLACGEIAVFTRKDNPIRIRKIDDLRGQRVGIALGGLTQKALVERIASSVYAAGDDSLMQMLHAERLDAILTAAPVAAATLRRLNLTDVIEQRGPILYPHPVYLVLHREHADLLPRLNKALAELIANGEWMRQMDIIHAAVGIPSGMGSSCLKGR